jgi:hypothetical protein
VDQANIILLNAARDRVEFPTLKQWAIDEYKEWDPDSVIIEKKASGAPLIYEMRSMGIPVQEFTPTRGNDKISRLNSLRTYLPLGGSGPLPPAGPRRSLMRWLSFLPAATMTLSIPCPWRCTGSGAEAIYLLR